MESWATGPGQLSARGWRLTLQTGTFETSSGIELGPGGGFAGMRLLSALAFGPDGHLLAVGADDSVQLWDPATDKLLRTLEADDMGGIRAVRVSPDGQLVAVAAGTRLNGTGTFLSVQNPRTYQGLRPQKLRLWETATGRYLRALQHHEAAGTIWSLAFSPDSRLLATGTKSGGVWLWNPATSDHQSTLQVSDDDATADVSALAFSPDGHLLAIGCGKTLQLWS